MLSFSLLFVTFYLFFHQGYSQSQLCNNGKCNQFMAKGFNIKNSSKELRTLETNLRNFSCFCDDSCDFYNDCCQRTPRTPSTGGLTSCIKELSEEDVWTRFLGSNFKYEIGFYLVDKCPSKTSTDLKKECQDTPSPEQEVSNLDYLKRRIPVTDRKRKILYKNKYCALCNLVSETNFEYWPMELSNCKKEPSQSQFKDIISHIKELGCVYTFKSDYQLRPCLHKNVATENIKDEREKDLFQKCRDNPTGYVYGKNECFPFQNEACMRFANQTFGSCYRNSTLKCTNSRHLGKFGKESFGSLSVLFDFNKDKIIFTSGEHVLKEKCLANNQIYDPAIKKCVSLGPECDDAKNIPCCTLRTISRENVTEEVWQNKKVYILNEAGYIPLSKSVYNNETNDITYCLQNVEYKGMAVLKPEDEVRSLISMVCTGISIIALLVLILIYSTIAKLRNVPGKCVMQLAFALLFAYLSFFIGTLTQITSRKIPCTIFAIATHYFFLVTFFWMLIFAYDIWQTFSNVTKRSKNRIRIFLYSLFAWGVPGLVILTTSLLHFEILDIKELQPRYGELGFCWLGTKEAILFLIICPLTAILVLNMVLFSLTVYHICSVTQRTRNATRNGSSKDSQRQGPKVRLFLYVKLSLIMGIGWITVYAAVLTQENVLWYISDIINGLYGLILCLAFSCTKHSRQLISERISTLTSTDSSRGSWHYSASGRKSSGRKSTEGVLAL